MNSARRTRIVLLLSVILSTVALHAFARQSPSKLQTPAKPSSAIPSTDPKSQKLPLRRVVLYKSGVGYFEHDGHVFGNEDIDINLTSSQLDDVLKSLTALDLSGGRITGASYNSKDSASHQLESLPVGLGDSASLKDLLVELRGARLEVHTPSGAFSGRLVSVEEPQRNQSTGNSDADTDQKRTTTANRSQISLMSDSGEMRLFPLDSSTSIRFADHDLEQQLAHMLGLMDSTHQEDTRHLVLSTAGTGERQIRVSYISEVPVWKTTYRIVLPSAANSSVAKPLLQGWAVVDNTVGEDWNNIELSLAAGAPQSFIQHISQPYYIERPEVPMPKGVLLSPQTHSETLNPSLVAAPMLGHGSATGSGGGAGGGIGSGYGSGTGGGIGAAFSSDALLLKSDVAASAADEAEFFNAARNINAAQGNKLGDLFQYTLKDRVSIHKNESALVPIIQTDIAAEKVALWNAGLGSARPLRALWITNSSSLVLDGGSFSVVEGGAFAGEGLIDPIQPGEKRLISYAADLAIQVVAKSEGVPQKITNLRINKGILIRTVDSRQRVNYTVRNEDASARTLILEHPVRVNWKLTSEIKPEEESASAYRFRIEVPSKETKTFTVEETKADTARIALTNMNSDAIETFVKSNTLTPQLEQAMREILAQKSAIAKIDADLKSKESAITDIVQDQNRLRENMKSLKGTPEEKSLNQRYTSELNDQETQLATLRREHATLQASRKQAQQELDSSIEQMTIDPAPM
nr:DUF4139 domain-containing protein [Candidatus Acidoferrales bacterium]